ncbi:MAG: hypothetical protein JXR37_26770 [Kiritimatiellae bacterium]|nr:hypothetical protein [Kiritimatiellia bacterium]
MTTLVAEIGTQTLTNRERILGALRGEETDRFPVWLKMANRTWQLSQPAPYRAMEALDLLRAAGCDLMAGNSAPIGARHPHVRQTREERDGIRRTVIATPDGDLMKEQRHDPTTDSWHPSRYPVRTAEDLRAFRWVYTDTRYRVDEAKAQDAVQRRRRLESHDIFVNGGTSTSPLMEMVEHVCGPENTVYLLFDEPGLFREVLAIMHEDRLRRLEAALRYPVSDTYWLNENTSTTLISPGMFEEFCVPHLTAYGNAILAAGLIPVHHMCGTLHALLERIDALPATVNEAFTTRPVGDVSLAEGRRRMPSKALIGGTNATLWLEPVETIVATVAEDLARCPDRRRIFLSSAGVLPPPVSFEKARRVVDALKNL